LWRKQILLQLGGWDPVRVAADYELHQRLQRAYGAHSVQRVAPGIPLVFARQLPGSLTTAAATHLRTMFYGARRLYQELFETWHASVRDLRDLCLASGGSRRPFPAPAPLLHKDTDNERSYDWVIMADLSASAAACE